MTTSAPHARSVREGSPLLLNLMLCLLGSGLLVCSHHLAIEFDHFVIGYSETSVCALGFALGAALLVWRMPANRWTLPIILAFAVLCRLALLVPEPYLSSDIYRYVWDGMVQHHGISPYRYFPGNEHLRAFRDEEIFPNINRRDYAPTIYPPGAQIFFYLVTALSPTLAVMKLAFLAAECVTVYALVRLLEELGRSREQVIVYAWSPLAIWEFGSSGHLDALVIALLVLALLFRYRNQPLRTGFALGAAVMVKFYPLLLFPAIWRRRDWRMPAALGSVIVTGYAIYAHVGWKVFGFAGGYVAEEGLDSGSRYYLLELARKIPGLGSLPSGAFLLFCALCFVPLFWWAWRVGGEPVGGRDARFLRLAAAMAFALMLLFSPHYPWYVAWLLPLFLLAPDVTVLVYVYSVFYWLTTSYATPGPPMFYANSWNYGVTAGVALVMGFVRLWRARRPAQTLRAA